MGSQVDLRSGAVSTIATVSESATSSLPFSLVQWLANHAGFPGVRLPARAELMLCFVAAVACDEAPGATGAMGRKVVERRNVAQDASLRAHVMRRKRTHFKCDNSAKV